MYRDPEGIHCLEQRTNCNESVKNTADIDNTKDSYYKKRIESLNEEIKALNNKLNMVKYVY